MDRDYSYAELCRMKKKRVIKIAGYRNMKALLKDGLNRVNNPFTGSSYENASKKYIARIIASDK